jgi:protein-S-isoprenylcysteine O-methyltransferase Ste14
VNTERIATRRSLGSLILNAALVALVLIAPLIGSERLLAPAPWIAAAAAWLLLVSQPRLDRRTAWSRDAQDQRSAAGIFASMIAMLVLAVAEYRFRGGLLPLTETAAVAAGTACIVVGFAIRLWAIRVLGAYFTSTVEVDKRQPVVTAGPYACVRHPSYTGALLIALGLVVLFRSALGLGVVLALVLPSYARRINVEERSLVDALGTRYRAYRDVVPALVPRLNGLRRRLAANDLPGDLR